MTREAFWSLVRQTLLEPRDAARRILSLGLPTREGWQALALMAVLNTLVYSLSVRLTPPREIESLGMVGSVVPVPLIFAVVLFLSLAATAVAVVTVGRALGGAGTLAGMLVLLSWMQALRLMVQVALMVIALAMPALAGVIVIVAAVWGLYIMLAFTAEVHGFDNLWRAAGVLIIGVVVLVFGLSLLLSLLGVRVAGGA